MTASITQGDNWNDPVVQANLELLRVRKLLLDEDDVNLGPSEAEEWHVLDDVLSGRCISVHVDEVLRADHGDISPRDLSERVMGAYFLQGGE